MPVGRVFCSHLQSSVTGSPFLSVLTAVEMKDLLSSPSPHKEPLRPRRGEPANLLQLLNHAVLLCVCVRGGETVRARRGPVECYLFD